jgi:hypothetical protein
MDLLASNVFLWNFILNLINRIAHAHHRPLISLIILDLSARFVKITLLCTFHRTLNSYSFIFLKYAFGTTCVPSCGLKHFANRFDLL